MGPASIRLAKEFLAHHHWSHPEDLGGTPQHTELPAFVGDDSDGVYYRAGSVEAADIMSEDQVELPSESVAAAWGSPGRTSPRRESAGRIEKFTVNCVEVVYMIPDGVRQDSRVLVLFGGRGWPGEKATVAHGAPCSLWGEDDTRQIKPCDRIDAEFRNPLYNSRIAALWRR